MREAAQCERTRDREKGPNTHTEGEGEEQREMKRAGVLFIHLPLH